MIYFKPWMSASSVLIFAIRWTIGITIMKISNHHFPDVVFQMRSLHWKYIDLGSAQTWVPARTSGRWQVTKIRPILKNLNAKYSSNILIEMRKCVKSGHRGLWFVLIRCVRIRKRPWCPGQNSKKSWKWSSRWSLGWLLSTSQCCTTSDKIFQRIFEDSKFFLF